MASLLPGVSGQAGTSATTRVWWWCPYCDVEVFVGRVRIDRVSDRYEQQPHLFCGEGDP